MYCAIVYWLTHCNGSLDTWDRLFFNVFCKSKYASQKAQVGDWWQSLRSTEFYSNSNSFVDLKGVGKGFWRCKSQDTPKATTHRTSSLQHVIFWSFFSNKLDKVNLIHAESDEQVEKNNSELLWRKIQQKSVCRTAKKWAIKALQSIQRPKLLFLWLITAAPKTLTVFSAFFICFPK